MISFAAIDFETATSERSSACAVGVVIVEDGVEVACARELVRPNEENEYDRFNFSIHGITPSMTANAPTFDQVWEGLRPLIGGRLLVAHNTAFDLFVLAHSSAAHGYDPGALRFVCSYRLARAHWPNMWGYRLDILAAKFGMELDHHDPVADARVSGLIAQRVCRELGAASVEDAAVRLGFRVGEFSAASHSAFSNASNTPGSRPRAANFTYAGERDADHPLFGITFSFTGTMQSMSRSQAAQAVVDRGGSFLPSPGAKVRYLVVGETDFSVVKEGMSAKLRKAVELAERGTGIEIIDEEQFLQMIDVPPTQGPQHAAPASTKTA